MPATLSRADVLRIAELAHLDLSDADVDLFARQLGEILDYVATLEQVDTTGVRPTSHALVADSVWRDDVPTPCLDRADALANAPDAAREAGLFTVPAVL
jgi:aspartyl-tRNA(Asn)/glutamyl-tRNA(Gln) amidotransferase subunit C